MLLAAQSNRTFCCRKFTTPKCLQFAWTLDAVMVVVVVDFDLQLESIT
jgi:hypothetical protein